MAPLTVLLVGQEKELREFEPVLAAAKKFAGPGGVRVEKTMRVMDAVSTLGSMGHCDVAFLSNHFTAPGKVEFSDALRKVLHDKHPDTPVVCYGHTSKGGKQGEHYHYALEDSEDPTAVGELLARARAGDLVAEYTGKGGHKKSLDNGHRNSTDGGAKPAAGLRAPSMARPKSATSGSLASSPSTRKPATALGHGDDHHHGGGAPLMGSPSMRVPSQRVASPAASATHAVPMLEHGRMPSMTHMPSMHHMPSMAHHTSDPLGPLMASGSNGFGGMSMPHSASMETGTRGLVMGTMGTMGTGMPLMSHSASLPSPYSAMQPMMGGGMMGGMSASLQPMMGAMQPMMQPMLGAMQPMQPMASFGYGAAATATPALAPAPTPAAAGAGSSNADLIKMLAQEVMRLQVAVKEKRRRASLTSGADGMAAAAPAMVPGGGLIGTSF